MNHYHISLVGSQAYPAYLGIADLKPDGVILVHSESTRGEAMLIKEHIDIPSQLLLLDPVHIDIIYSSVKSLRHQIDENDFYSINLTGGTKVWSIAFYEYFRFVPNVQLIYVDQNNWIYDLCNQERHLSEVRIDIDLVLQLNGINAPQYTPFDEYDTNDQNCLKKIRELRSFSRDGIKALSVIDDSQYKLVMENSTGELTVGQHKVQWDKNNFSLRVEVVNRHGEKKTATLRSKHIFSLFFHTGWFEYWVALILSRWSQAKEVRLNVLFPYTDKKNPKNEIDIVVNTGNRLLFVECKTQIYDITDIDKFRTAVKNYGGMGAKSLFITLERMKETSAEKCKDSGILSFSMADCNVLTPEQMLFLLLDQELLAINKK